MKIISKFLGLGCGSKKIDWIIPLIRDKIVLDIGCIGEYENPEDHDNWPYRIILNEAKECIGLDNNKDMIERLATKGFNIIYAQNFAINKKFEVIVAGDLIEHLHDFKGFFTSVKLHLTNDGYLILTTPNPWFFLNYLRCLTKGDSVANPHHTVWFCKQTVEEMLRRYGFKVDRIEYGSGEPIFYKLWLLPQFMRHSSLFIVASLNNSP